jgi:hypothetical protein
MTRDNAEVELWAIARDLSAALAIGQSTPAIGHALRQAYNLGGNASKARIAEWERLFYGRKT